MKAEFGDPRIPSRIWDRIVIEEDKGCWLYPSTYPTGYSRIYADGTAYLGHRYLYIILVGVFNEPQLDHLCKVINCVNPSHLEPVSSRENLMRGNTLAAENAKKIHCPKGHELVVGNLRTEKDGTRNCLTCHRERESKRREKARENGLCTKCMSSARTDGKSTCEACRVRDRFYRNKTRQADIRAKKLLDELEKEE